MKINLFLLLIISLLSLHNSLRIKKKDTSQNQELEQVQTEGSSKKLSDIAQEKGGDSDKIPIINVHMEEPDRDPIEVKRYEEERRIERNRIRDLEAREEMDKRAFQQIIAIQTGQLAKLTNIAEATSNILGQLAASTPSSNTMEFIQNLQKINHDLETKDGGNVSAEENSLDRITFSAEENSRNRIASC